MRTRGARRIVALAAVGAVLASGVLSAEANITASRLATQTLANTIGLSPQDFGAASVDGLQYADPKEALALIDAPVPNSDGAVQLSYPLSVPPGHGITPQLTVQYGSGGANGWMGEGWDLSVGSITVDTSFGAPHFAEDFESESYLLDGALLTPNANDDAWEARVDGDRSDFSRQVETTYDEIIRHQIGTTWPADYYWEVRGKDGSVRWYGGTPDSGGPVPATPGTIDERAVVRNDAGHIVSWLLSAQRDIGVNLIRYEYETVEYEFDGSGWGVADCDPSAELCGRHTFLDRVLYTDATSAIADHNGAPYEIDFVRESELAGSGAAVRQDPVVDAGLGYVDVVVDRLGRVEVKHGAPSAPGTARTYDTIAARYEFTYGTGRFGKSLLTEVIQGVDDPHVHEIEYYDDLTGTPTDVDGFATGVDLATADTGDTDGDVSDITFLDTTADVSTLGGSETNAGSGNIYIGFNPITPSKTFSVGVGLELSGGDTDAVVEWIDLNGDNLPDKVFLDGSTVKFRLNNTGPSGTGGDWPLNSVTGINGLSENSNFGFQVSAEAYPLVALGLGTGLSFSWTGTYFSDVNGDGFVDFVSGGTVYFNTPDADGIPTFSTSSAGTPIPLDPAPLPDLSSAELAEITATLALQSPPIDTVRRFIAPYTGTVSIDAAVALDAVGATSTDGVRVAVQHNDAEVATEVLQPGATTAAFGAPIVRDVTAGDRLYFRVGARDDGVSDSVEWTPVITYQSPAWPATDANGLSQVVFAAESDFTLAGRPSDFVAMPYAGVVQVDASVTTTAPLTDDLTVVAVKRDANGVDTPFVLGTIPAGTAAGAVALSQPVPVALTELPDASDPTQVNIVADKLSVYAAVDSPVDLAAVDFSSVLTYSSIEDATGNEQFEHHVRPHVEIYPYADTTAGVATTTALTSGANVLLAVQASPAAASGISTVEAVITVKSTAGLDAKVATNLTVLPGGVAVTPTPVALGSFGGPADKWVEVSIRDNIFGRDGLTLQKFVVVPSPGVETPVPDVVLRWSGLQGIFPQPYRGWGVAGYTAGGGLGDTAMAESAFVIDPSSYPTDEPTRDDASLDEAHTEPSYAFVPAPASTGGTTGEPVATDRWVGARANLYADATTASTSRLALDSVDFTGVTGTPSGGGRSAPTRLGISGPGLTLSFGVGPLGASAALSPSFGLTDFEDLNGDGYPDVVSTGSVTYTNQLGTYLDSRSVDRTSVTNQDLTIAVNGGLSAGMVDITPNTKGSTNAVASDSAGKGQSASDSGPSFSLGISGSGGYSWSSPNASSPGGPSESTYADQVDSLQSDFGATPGAEIQRAFADINGDGLADSVYTNADGVFAFYNLGYGFTSHAVRLGGGGFESRESATGGAGLGFSLPYAEFGGGVNLLFNYDWSTYSWRDVNGDGILDRLRRESTDSIKVAFGTGSGVLTEVDYGDLVSVPVSPGIDGGEHIAFDRSSGIGGGVSATAYIGPLCLVACYLVIGGGGGYNNSRSASTADLTDVNGDGFADSLLSLNDNVLSASINQQGRTNLLHTVTNPLGGSFSVDYERVGNTFDHPDSLWVMSRVDIDDGRSSAVDHDGRWTTGDYASTIEYAGLRYDRTHRASLGFDTVTITEVDTTAGDARLRINEQQYLNDSVFVKGLMTSATMFEPDDTAADGRVQVRGSSVTWGFRIVRATQPVAADFDAQAPVVLIGADDLGADVHTVASRGWSIAPLVSAHDEYWFDGPDVTIFERRTEVSYDGLGNVLVERDLGAPDDAFDDLTTTMTYSTCTAASDTVNGCLPVASPRQPFWSPGTCVNWASYPTRVAVEGVDRTTGAATLLRERLSPVQMCDNGAATTQHELVSFDGGTPTYATTNMTLNQYGDYALVMAPAGADDVRYTVRYTYDDDRHSNVSQVEEFDVLDADAADVLANGPSAANSTAGISSSATFDPLSGRVASKTDANGATRSYVYDEHGRIVQTSTVATASSPATDLITFEYHANDPEYGYAIARHVDTFAGNDPAGSDDAVGHDTTATIDTITFVDGLGRVRETKRDARLSVGGAPPINTRQVSDGVDFDPLARPVIQYGPTVDAGPAATFSADVVNGAQTATTWFSYDLRETYTEPGDRTTTYDYPWESINGSPLLAWTVATNAEGRATIVAQDVRDVVRFNIDQPAPRFDAGGNEVEAPPELVTEYVVDSLGQLEAVIDSAGETSSYTYDLTGRQTSATTPNGGTVRTTYDLAGHERVTVNEAMAAIGEETSYDYELNRLTAIDHPGTVDDVTYEYGLDNSDGRFTAGRIRHLEDRTRLLDNTYDKTGALVEQTATIKRHNWRPDLTAEELQAFTYTTQWTYDDLGRIASVRYPDAKTVEVVPDGTSVAALTSPDQLSTLLEAVDLEGELVSYDYDSGGMLRNVSGAEEGIQLVGEQIAPDLEGNVATIQVPRLTTHTYAYLNDRVYNQRLRTIHDEMGNGTVTDYSFDADTTWLDAKRTTGPNGLEIQDLAYTYDIVGRPLTYDNNLPLANRAINGGDVAQAYSYDGFGRLRGATGTFDLKAGEQQRYTYGAEFTPDAPWSVVAKEQTDALVTTKGKPKSTIDVERTYSFERTLGTPTGPLQVVGDELTVSGAVTKTYDYRYNANGAIDSMLVAGSTGTASETNVWDRTFTWTLMNQMTSAHDGSELRTFAYTDTGALMIQDGNLLTRDGDVVAQHGGGPETIFLNAWVTIRAQKIYKHVNDGLDKIVTKMDSGATREDKQMFLHTDVVGSTNIVTDDQGRGFQRHEYFPSGEIWIIDNKEEIRTPFQFGDGYYEDEFDIILFGARWYDTERELFLSPDPLLAARPRALIDQPALGAAYTYAGANAVGNVDPDGMAFFTAQQSAAVTARAQAAFDLDQFVLEISGDGDKAQANQAARTKQLEGQARAEAVLEPSALIDIDLNEGTVSIGPPYGPRKEWSTKGGNDGSPAAPTDDSQADDSPSLADDSLDASDGSGGPDAGSDGASPGSARVSVDDGDLDAGTGSDSSSEAGSGDDGSAGQRPGPSPLDHGAAGGADNSRSDD